MLSEVTNRCQVLEDEILKAYEDLHQSKNRLSEQFLDANSKCQEFEEQVENLVLENHKLSDRCTHLERSRDEMKRILDNDQRFVELEKSVSNMYAFVLQKNDPEDDEIIEQINPMDQSIS